MNIWKKTPKKREGEYFVSELTIRQDSKTRELCLYTYEIKKTENEGEILCKETNVKDPENVIRWIGRPLPGRPKWARNYIKQADYEQYGAICLRIEIFSKYSGEEYDENRIYTKEHLVELIDGINRKRRVELNKLKEEREC